MTEPAGRGAKNRVRRCPPSLRNREQLVVSELFGKMLVENRGERFVAARCLSNEEDVLKRVREYANGIPKPRPPLMRSETSILEQLEVRTPESSASPEVVISQELLERGDLRRFGFFLLERHV